MSRPTLPADATRRLRWPPLRLTAAGGMVAERLWHGFWPLVTVLLGGLALLGGSGALNSLVPPPFWTALAIGVIALLAFAWGGVRRFAWPARGGEVLARLDATLPGQPIAALLDDQAIGRADAGGSQGGVWAAHQARMAARLKGARPVEPDLRVAAADPYALRLAALIAAIMVAGFGSFSRVAEVSLPTGPPAAQAALVASWEGGWVEPPAYTGKPSLYLNDQPAGPLAVPMGSRVTLRLYGQEGMLGVIQDVTDAPPEPGIPFEITQNGALEVTGPPGGRAWRITAIGDVPPPAVRAEGPLERALDGTMTQAFVATDDYGVVAGRAEFTLNLDTLDRRHGLLTDPEPRDPIVVDLPMPFRGDRGLIEEVLHENFMQHPWAEMPVTMRLIAEDAAGQMTQSQAQEIILPGRRFLNPLAQALIEQRRDLLWTRANGPPRVAQVLRAVGHNADEDLFPSIGHYLKLRLAIRELEAAMAPPELTGEARDRMAQVLWDMAVAIEEGSLGDALARLQRAQERLAEAMEQGGASPEELAELMDELREAMRDYMNQLAQQQPQGEQPPPGENMMTMTPPQDLADMMERIEELMREGGRMDEAMAALEMLRELMENMQVTQGQPGQGGQSPPVNRRCRGGCRTRCAISRACRMRPSATCRNRAVRRPRRAKAPRTKGATAVRAVARRIAAKAARARARMARMASRAIWPNVRASCATSWKPSGAACPARVPRKARRPAILWVGRATPWTVPNRPCAKAISARRWIARPRRWRRCAKACATLKTRCARNRPRVRANRARRRVSRARNAVIRWGGARPGGPGGA